MSNHTKAEPRVMRLADTTGMLRLIAANHLRTHDAYFAMVNGIPTKIVS